MTLPTERTKPSDILWDHSIYLYGPPMIGKSSLVNEIPGVLFFNTAGGLESLPVYETRINAWEDFLTTGAEFLTGSHNFAVAAIDTIERLHKLCVQYIIKRENIRHPQDLEFGKGYDMVKDEFIRPLTKLALSKYGLIMIGHTRDVEITLRTRKLSKNIPTLQDYIWQLVAGLSDIIMFYTTETTDKGTRRVIKTNPSEEYIAGDRTNKLRSFGDIVMLPEGNNWARIEEAFNRVIPTKGEDK